MRIINPLIGFASKIDFQIASIILIVHVGSIYGIYLAITCAKWQTILLAYVIGVLSGIGTLAGAHRFFSHRSFSAKWQLRLILCFLQTLSGQKSIIVWARDHHLHHKYTGTNADVVNINRGFFYAHIGWLFLKRHPECEEKGKNIDLNYLWSDPIVKYQYVYYAPLFALINVIIPTVLPYYLFDETIINGFYICFMFRYFYTLHLSFFGNSAAHMWGDRPYDNTLSATNNELLNYATLGAVNHNFHHLYPWDYNGSEFDWKSNFNIYTVFIDFFSYLGWATNLKRVPQTIIDERKQKTGDNYKPKNFIKKHPILDWIFGFLISGAVVWTAFPTRMLYSYLFCS